MWAGDTLSLIHIFEAWTRPDLLKRWLWGPDEWQLAVCEIDLRIGGVFRFVWRRRDGKANDMGMGGVYREAVLPDRLVFTEVWDEMCIRDSVRPSRRRRAPT